MAKNFCCFECGKRKLKQRDRDALVDESVFICGNCGYETNWKFIKAKATAASDEMMKRFKP